MFLSKCQYDIYLSLSSNEKCTCIARISQHTKINTFCIEDIFFQVDREILAQ